MDSHPIRNGVIATVVGGIILTLVVPQLRNIAIQGFNWVGSGFSWLWNSLISTYSVSGWVLLIIGFVALIGMIAVYLLLQEIFSPEYKKYTEDHFHGVKWRWSWSGREISNLWCYCPSCDGELVYNDTSRFSFEESETKFFCEHCNNKEVTTIKGGDKYYAKNAVKREIRRKIRTSDKKL